MINLVYYSPELRVHRDGSIERYYKTKKEWKKVNNKPNLKGYLMINIDYEDIRISRLISFCYLGLCSLKHTIEEIDHIDNNPLTLPTNHSVKRISHNPMVRPLNKPRPHTLHKRKKITLRPLLTLSILQTLQ